MMQPETAQVAPTAPEPAPAVSGRILRMPQVLRKTGLGRNTIYVAMRRGAFPQSVVLLGGRVGWLEADIDAWIANRPRRAARPSSPDLSSSK
jgi:prophage regulatory protein